MNFLGKIRKTVAGLSLVKDRLSTAEGGIQGGIQNPLAKDSVNTLLVGGRGFWVVFNTRAGHALFLRFALALSRSLAELFALALSLSFLGLKFRAFAFALSRSLIFRALFSRSLIFRALFSRS
jgi:hypothetical protein